VGADDPAYIAFTSGSTGEPKAVICRHGPITHFLPWQKETFALGERDRFAMLSGLAYSHLHRDVFTAIHLGAALYIPSETEARAPELLTEWLQRHAITILHLTPALGQLLLTCRNTRLPAVRRIFFGGDVLSRGTVEHMRQLAPNAELASFYGASETQRAVGYFAIPASTAASPSDDDRPVPLGRGIQDVQLLVLTPRRQLAGVGELGEIFVRSPHLAQGYLNDDDRTAEMFWVNPFTGDPRDRLYRTGELGRYRPDGNVEWAGRNDRRVNLRGFRIELEEIERALKRHPSVTEAAVIVKQLKPVTRDISGDPKAVRSSVEAAASGRAEQNLESLIAYVAAEPHDGERQSFADLLHGYLSTRLPHYMIPARLIIVDALPLTPNGKIDFSALPPVPLASDLTRPRPPRNDIERKLQAILAEVLGHRDIGVEANFFRLGGHSLLAARAAARIGDAFGVALPLASFLAAPTVAGLARELEARLSSGREAAPSINDPREEFEI
jgi:amino acid adenylation domain-containing protein